MQDMLREYLAIFIFIGIAVGLSGIILIASYIVARQKPDTEKVSAYECGFEAFDDARGQFDVRFYLVAVLFIIVDLDIALLFPWAISLGEIGDGPVELREARPSAIRVLGQGCEPVPLGAQARLMPVQRVDLCCILEDRQHRGCQSAGDGERQRTGAAEQQQPANRPPRDSALHLILVVTRLDAHRLSY